MADASLTPATRRGCAHPFKSAASAWRRGSRWRRWQVIQICPFVSAFAMWAAAGLATTDLINARAILQGSRRTLELLATTPADRPLSIQIYGSGQEMADGARWLEEYGATAIDINMGCPVRKVVKSGGGSAMMCDTTGATVALVRQVVEAVRIPVTVKMRLGWDKENLSVPLFARSFRASRRGRGHDSWPNSRPGFLRQSGLGGDPPRGRSGRTHPRFGERRCSDNRRRGANAEPNGLCRHRHRPRRAWPTPGCFGNFATTSTTGIPARAAPTKNACNSWSGTFAT